MFLRALIGYSISEYPVLFTDSPPVPPNERRQTRVNYEQNGFPVCYRNPFPEYPDWPVHIKEPMGLLQVA